MNSRTFSTKKGGGGEVIKKKGGEGEGGILGAYERGNTSPKMGKKESMVLRGGDFLRLEGRLHSREKEILLKRQPYPAIKGRGGEEGQAVYRGGKGRPDRVGKRKKP